MCSMGAAHLYGTLVRFKKEVSRRASSGSFAGRAAGVACVPARPTSRVDHFWSWEPCWPQGQSGTQVTLTWDIKWQASSGSWQSALWGTACLPSHLDCFSILEPLQQCYAGSKNRAQQAGRQQLLAGHAGSSGSMPGHIVTATFQPYVYRRHVTSI